MHTPGAGARGSDAALCRCARGFGFTTLHYFDASGAGDDGRHVEARAPETHVIRLVLKYAVGHREEPGPRGHPRRRRRDVDAAGGASDGVRPARIDQPLTADRSAALTAGCLLPDGCVRRAQQVSP
jgi:hypothetical protein